MGGVIVHEWMAATGGSENVVEAFARLYPDADIVCLWNDAPARFDPARVRETWLARTPLRRVKRAAVPLMPLVWHRLPNRGYDWALISSHVFAHHARFRGRETDLPRYVYVHTPARYLWAPDLDRRGAGLAARLVGAALKPVDRRRARSGASFTANSQFVRERIRSAWDVDAGVIYPPVEVEQIQSVADWRTRLSPAECARLEALPEQFVLGASRFVPYKRLDLVVRTGELLGLPVVLAGRGPERDRLEAIAAEARVPVHFLHSPSRALLWALYQRCLLYVFPAVDDFGIMPVEAMAAGAPVLAQAVGGAAESVAVGRTGSLVTFTSADDIRAGAGEALSTERHERLRRAKDFSVSRFNAEVSEWVEAAR